MKFIKIFQGVPDGEIYPVEYQPGEECPPELEAGATAVGAIEGAGDGGNGGGGKPSDGLKVEEIKAALAAKGVEIPEGVTLKAELAALLDGAA